ncbi:MAG: 1-acyl-sn-glycerol-3-phosphate acyltransferase [Clostridiales bacterium]|jgi:1-acyl-sn-glycerol-3-phosphate acyltransferase|nr:1-acyl-sn-glycerol-3-phosphate acyltransferase [Clostridiales bacterium]
MFYRFAKAVMWLLTRVLYRVKSSGAENLPESGGFVLCSNHIKAMDPILLATSIKRRVYFMGKKELFENKLGDMFFRGLGGFPVDRKAADIRSYKKAVEILSEGNGLLVFSQGTRSEGLSGAKNGAAMFALKAGVPVVPAGISGEYRFFRKTRIRFGAPLTLEKYAGMKIKTDTLNTITEEIMGAVEECCGEADA